MLHNQGLIRGGSLDNAVVIVDKDMNNDELKQLLHTCGIEQNAVLGHNGILNNTMLRFKNEPARHKLLDMLGDLALIGVPIKGQILAARPGHASNIEFAKKLELFIYKRNYKKEFGEKNRCYSVGYQSNHKGNAS